MKNQVKIKYKGMLVVTLIWVLLILVGCQKETIKFSVEIVTDTKVTGSINNLNFEVYNDTFKFNGVGVQGDEVVVTIKNIDIPNFPETVFVRVIISSGDKIVTATPEQANPITLIL